MANSVPMVEISKFPLEFILYLIRDRNDDIALHCFCERLIYIFCYWQYGNRPKLDNKNPATSFIKISSVNKQKFFHSCISSSMTAPYLWKSIEFLQEKMNPSPNSEGHCLFTVKFLCHHLPPQQLLAYHFIQTLQS